MKRFFTAAVLVFGAASAWSQNTLTVSNASEKQECTITVVFSDKSTAMYSIGAGKTTIDIGVLEAVAIVCGSTEYPVLESIQDEARSFSSIIR